MDTLVRPGDVVAIYIEESLAFYARVEEITFDGKKGWRKFRFLVLSSPLRDMTWILEPVQIDGQPFSMGGTPIRIERVPDAQPLDSDEEAGIGRHSEPSPSLRTDSKVISFPGRCKK